jgi:hypothetical protein
MRPGTEVRGPGIAPPLNQRSRGFREWGRPSFLLGSIDARANRWFSALNRSRATKRRRPDVRAAVHLCWFLATPAFVLLAPTAPSALCCDSVLVPRNREIFHGATAIYEGVATSDSYSFAIHRTWRGTRRESLVVQDPAIRYGDCWDQRKPRKDGQYLIILYDNVPVPGLPGVVRGEAGFENLQEAITLRRLDFLRADRTLPRWELAAQISIWLKRNLSTRDFATWLVEADETSSVDDWFTVGVGTEHPITDSLTDYCLRSVREWYTRDYAPCTGLEKDTEAALRLLLPRFVRLLESREQASAEDLEALDKAVDAIPRQGCEASPLVRRGSGKER